MEKFGVITKLCIRAGGIELEVEGADLNMDAVIGQFAEVSRSVSALPSSAKSVPSSEKEVVAAPSVEAALISTNTIASLMDAATGSDLVMAAMAHLTLVQRRETVPRRDLLEEMKAARTFYKDTFSGNLSSYLDTLAKTKRLNLVSKDTYALPHAERQNLERLIAHSA